ncbi:flagellum biosynthesis protein FlbT [Tabrizicola sp. WMC-M-20]|nr:flagellum biosynthesis protein FlbT [Tabrizicola sp. WMC-M-20]
MALKLTLKPNERVVVNGCVIRNSDRRHVLVIENRADVVREDELLDETAAGSPVGRVYFLMQTALMRADLRSRLTPEIQRLLADLVPVFRPETTASLFAAANFVSMGNFYKAMRMMRPVLHHEARVLDYMAQTATQA